MRFLIDENLSWRLAELIIKAGHDAVHVRALVDRRPAELAGIISANLDNIRDHLDTGAVAAFTQDSIRVRPLPLR
jgi:predicted nuclease of predicted toxin-antitoxin system